MNPFWEWLLASGTHICVLTEVLDVQFIAHATKFVGISKRTFQLLTLYVYFNIKKLSKENKSVFSQINTRGAYFYLRGLKRRSFESGVYYEKGVY